MAKANPAAASRDSDAVSACIAALTEPQRALAAALRALVLAADGAITEHIKWNAPSFCHSGDDRATMRLMPKGGVQLILHRGAKVKDAAGFRFADPDGLAKWPAKDRGVVTLGDVAELESKAAALTALVRRWVAATASP